MSSPQRAYNVTGNGLAAISNPATDPRQKEILEAVRALVRKVKPVPWCAVCHHGHGGIIDIREHLSELVLLGWLEELVFDGCDQGVCMPGPGECRICGGIDWPPSEAEPTKLKAEPRKPSPGRPGRKRHTQIDAVLEQAWLRGELSDRPPWKDVLVRYEDSLPKTMTASSLRARWSRHPLNPARTK